VPPALLVLLELVLSLAGFGYPAQFFLPSRWAGREVFNENQRFTWRFFPPGLARYPEPLAVAATKPSNSCRIFVLGESAALGDPEPAFGFSRQLGVLLRDRFPGPKFEIINTGITAINSHVVRAIAAGCARQQADLWIVFMGNNEVVGPYGAGTVFSAQAPSLVFIRTILALNATWIGQFAAKAGQALRRSPSQPQEWGGMTMFTRQKIRFDDARMRTVYHHFQRNLADIVQAGIRSGARILLCTLPVNLKDCAPFASLHRPNLTGAELAEWNRCYQDGVKLEAARQYAGAIQCFQQAARLDDHFADLHFRLGHCLEQSSQFALAKEQYSLARDDDALRFRADSRINDIIRQTAAHPTSPGVTFLDIEEVIARQSPHDLPGEELLLEHVHLNFDGNYLVAKALADQIATLLPADLVPAKSSGWMDKAECARRLAWTPWNRYQTAETIHERFLQPPFTFQLDHADRLVQWDKKMAELRPLAKPYAQKMAANEYRQALAISPEDWRLHDELAKLLLASGDDAGAADQWRQVVQSMPNHSRAHYYLGEILDRLGQSDEALRQFRTALEIRPDFHEAINGIGLALAHQGQWKGALAAYERCLRIKPDNAEAHRNLAAAAARLGETGKAVAHYQETLRLQPDQPDIHLVVGKLLAGLDRRTEAIAHLSDAIRLNPDSAAAHFNLGLLLAQEHRPGEAAQQFQETLRIEPNHAEARKCLASPSPGLTLPR